MKKFEYEVFSIGGFFKRRDVKLRNIQKLCDEKGPEGWELIGITYDWFFVTYTLVFKREIKPGSDATRA